MTLRRAVAARLLRLARDLAGAATLRRTEARASTYALRLLCLGLLGAVAVAKAVQLGPLGFALAALKAAAGVALVAGALSAVLALQDIARRGRGGRAA